MPDSPKTVEEFTREIYKLLEEVDDQYSLGDGHFIMSVAKTGVKLLRQVPAYIDAQKADVTENAREFAERIASECFYPRGPLHAKDLVAQLTSTRDQKLVQEAVKPYEELIKQAACQHENTLGGNDYLECIDCGLAWDYRSQYGLEHALRKAARALLSQPQTKDK